MRLLILGGNVFLGRAIARHAIEAGHDVTCAVRGRSGELVPKARFVAVDRDDPAGLRDLTGDFDTLVDVSRRPSHVRHAVAALAGRVGHATFVSTCSVYADQATPGQRVDTAPVLEPAPPEIDDPGIGPDYGPCKVACERAFLDGLGAERVFVCRAGLIVGPEDGSGRFDYWVRRVAGGGEILVPGRPDDLVQFVDVRDLAAWIVTAGERGLTGTLDGTGAAITRAAFMAALAAGVQGPAATLTYVPQDLLLGQGVAPWAGPRSLPLWLKSPEYDGFLSRDVGPSLDAGLRTRPPVETARDTHAGLGPDSPTIGLTEDEEAEVLRAYAQQ